jgi:hypothetical protein
VRRTASLALVLVVILSACRVDTTVTVRVHDDGSGVVTARVHLDASAVQAAQLNGDKLEQAVRLGDLHAAGWTSTGWVRDPQGGATLAISKPFARAQDAAGVVAELNGPDGPLRGAHVSYAPSRFTSKWSFSALGDMKNIQPGITTDPELVQRLSAQRVDVNAIDLQAIREIRDSFHLAVVADLPHASAKTFPIPTGTVVVMHTSSSSTDTTRIVAVVGGVAVILVAGLIVLLAAVSRRRRRSSRQRREPAGELA